jgi:hypothetical protein
MRHKVALQVLPDRRHGMAPALHALRELDLVPVTECPASADKPLRLARETIALLADLRIEAWDPVSDRGELRSVLVRTAEATGQSHVIVVARYDLPEVERIAQDLDTERTVTHRALDQPVQGLTGSHDDLDAATHRRRWRRLGHGGHDGCRRRSGSHRGRGSGDLQQLAQRRLCQRRDRRHRWRRRRCRRRCDDRVSLRHHGQARRADQQCRQAGNPEHRRQHLAWHADER